MIKAHDAGSNSSIEYPDLYPHIAPASHLHNPLTAQLRLIARLLKGGLKTRIFLCRMGGFDTHGNQTEKDDPSTGIHAALLYHLTSAIKAFHDDLDALGHGSRALTMTFTEFGRRVYSNDSYGTDHGTATPVLLFGEGLKPGMYGTNPDLSDLKGGNIKYSTDYRQIYASVLQDWFGASSEAMDAAGFTEWQEKKHELFTSSSVQKLSGLNQLNIYPNPAHNYFQFKINTTNLESLTVNIYSISGQLVQTKHFDTVYQQQAITVPVGNLPAGSYKVMCYKGAKPFANATLVKR
ncbi:MAG: DUF1501 domain-containing protein [Bacteroidales bacterium]|nr:DUF1501 domain-containing protein [Bacteroidales bacterium]